MDKLMISLADWWIGTPRQSKSLLSQVKVIFTSKGGKFEIRYLAFPF